jgi:hypothetical protein
VSMRPSVRLFLFLMAFVLIPSLALAIEPPQGPGPGFVQEISSPELEVGPSLVHHERGSAAAIPGLQRFFAHHSDQWEVRWDERGNRPNLIQGVGVPLLPGRGNSLAPAGEIQTAEVERRLRGFLGEFSEVLDVAGLDLRLDPKSTANVGEDKQIWLVELQQYHDGIPVEGANVYFRVNHGNIIQFGAEKVAPVRVNTTPRIDGVGALAAVLQETGFRAEELTEVPNPGTLKIVPALNVGERPAERYTGQPGRGYRHLLVWEVEFRRAGDDVTYQALVDARTGKVLRLVDLNSYVTAQVSGGIYPKTNLDLEVVRPFPFANVSNGGTTKVTNASGNYDYSGGTATVSLNGRYIRITDNCGSISLSNSTTGNVLFGTSIGTDCTTPGLGGAGNTHAARTGYYHLTNINRKAASFLTSNSWLNGTLTANMNINNTCNAFWNGSTVNFYRSGGGCSNTGELAAVFLHEWGHGMDTNSGGAASDRGTGEAVGDTFAFLETKDSCIGHNFKPGVPCYNCSTCTGVRDMGVFAEGGSRTIAKPSTVADNNGINCDRYSCPYNANLFTPYQGPMGYQGHCESYIASTANWDLAKRLVAYYGTTAGWAAMDRIWYRSLTPSKSAYQVASGGKCNPAAVVNGCGSTNWYTVYLSVDDNDGNLANGTPNGCRIWDAFNAHGIACGSRPACTQ